MSDDTLSDDLRWLAAAASLAQRARPLCRPNPGVAAILLRDGKAVGHGWTQPGGRPHAEAMALESAGSAAEGATLYVTLEPCAHHSQRGPACADLLAASGIARVVVGCADPDPRTSGQGLARLQAAGIEAVLLPSAEAAESLSGYLVRQKLGRPEVTLKLALSEDGRLARPPGESQWITGALARAHVHALRARMDAILVGGGTLRADQPRLDVRLPGLAPRSPERWLLTRGDAPPGWRTLHAPDGIRAMEGVQHLMVEGGAQTARAFLAAGLVDRLAIYRAPITIGGDLPALPELTAKALAAQADRWRLTDRRPLGSDTLEVYRSTLCSPE